MGSAAGVLSGSFLYCSGVNVALGSSPSGPGALPVTPKPFTPSVANAFLVWVGPRSGPPCLFDPPTTVGAGRCAPARHVAAPGGHQRIKRVAHRKTGKDQSA
jgi:hypothetical protein